MVKVQGLNDHKYLYSTVRIDGFTADGASKTGTGFYYNFGEIDGKLIIGIVTNKHVLENLTKATIKLIITDINGDTDDQNPLSIVIDDLQTHIIHHPYGEVDLCLIPLGSIFNEEDLPAGCKLSFYAFSEEDLITTEELEQVTAVEDVIMIGYPDGLMDEVNIKPIIRKGITATHMRFDYEDGKDFLIDMHSYSGSSGSPVFLHQIGIHGMALDLYYGLKSKIIGVLYAGYDVDEEGEMVKREIAYKRVPKYAVHLNIGLVIKAERITELGVEYIRQASEK